jgi:hypothetical protein
MRVISSILAAGLLAGCAAGPGSVDSSSVRDKTVRSGQTVELNGYRTYRRSLGCKTTSLPDIVITQPPANGEVTVSRLVSHFPVNNEGCGGRFLGRSVFYRSAPGFRGQDETSFIVTFQDGETRAARYRIDVR